MAVVAVFMVAVVAALAVAAGESERPGLISVVAVVAGIDRRRAVAAVVALAVAADIDRRRVAVVAVVARMSGHRQVAVAAVDTDRRRVVAVDTGHPHPHRPLIGTGVIL